jgi:hypothetical protein
MKRIFQILAITFILNSCNINPPDSHEEESYTSGKIFVTTKINFNQTSTAVHKVVLLEDFANVSCIPCVTSNQIIESLINVTYGAQKIAVIKFPTNFPSPVDPFYLANKPVCDERMAYYHILSAPTLIVDGTIRPNATDSDKVKERIDERLTQTPKFNILVTTRFKNGSYFVNLDIRAVNTIGINLDDIVLYTVLTETNIEFNEAPGSNGETKFFHVIRKILPSNDGIMFSSINQTDTLNWEDDLISAWNTDNLHVVPFIQNIKTKEILQSGSDY